MIPRKPRQTIVKVMRALSADGKPLPATIYEKGPRRIRQQMLSPKAEAALGFDLAAHFEAEDLNGQFWLGARLPDADRGW